MSIEAAFEVWIDILTSKADGQEKFMQQKYKTAGDLTLLKRTKDLFGKGEKRLAQKRKGDAHD